MEENSKTRIAAIGDIHVKIGDRGKWKSFFEKTSQENDILLLCGDLTDTGDEEEAEILAEDLRSCSIPVVAVMGNHDHEKGRAKTLRNIIRSDNVHLLDGESVIINDVGIAGVKGFGGGFDRYMLSMFGEEAMKDFVQEAVDESLQLDRALARLEAQSDDIKKVAIMHYAPVKETVIGEPEPIFPFLGCSHLAEPLDRRNVAAAFHGHAHAGTMKGTTPGGVEVYNVSHQILEKEGYNNSCFVYEV